MKIVPPIFVTLAIWLTSAAAQSVFINELHYDNASDDANEGVEIAGPAGTDLSAFKLVFYNGSNGSSYGELPLGGVLPAQNGTASGTAFFPRAGIQNGAPDGIALIDTIGNSVVQFLSYEGSFTAVGGDADGESSDDIGVSESPSGPATNSLQLTGSGAVYSDFSWQPPSTASPAMINSGQTFLGAGNPAITLTLMPSTLAEGTSTTATLSLFPTPAGPVTVNIANSDPGELDSPSTVTVPVSGSSTFNIDAIDDSLNDGTQRVDLTASATLYDPATTTALVQDIQRPTRGTAIRLATINTRNGIGPRDSEEFNALITLVERLEPDVVCFQEVSSASDFFDLRDLLADLGFAHLATTGDDFTGQPYQGGQFNNNQNLAIASRFPITSTTQIERGQTGRKEVTRYPLMVEIDVPDTSNDPVVVGIHYKATTDEASRFRKAVEAYRTIAAITAAGHDATTDNLFLLGDFNEDHDRFMPISFNTGNTSFGDGSSLPATFQLGSDLSGANSITIPYAQFPDHIFDDADIITPFHLQQDGVAELTFLTQGDAALDYILHSQRVADNGSIHTEIYHSLLDAAFDGMLKQGDPAPPETSFIASDHLAVIGDYQLDPNPPLGLTVSPAELSEDAGPAAATGTLTLPSPPATQVLVALSTARPDGTVTLPVDTLTFDPGETQKTFPIDINDRPVAGVDRTVSIIASAEDYSPASDTLLVYNLEASGRVIFSQYTEPPSAASPRGVELFNCGPADINLLYEPMTIVQYSNGSTSGSVEARVAEGIFPAGGVVVIGSADIGNYLVSQGLIPTPDSPISSAENGTSYSNNSGELVFVKDTFPYNGDDALEVQLAFGLADVFGTIGQDPGVAWQSNGVTTSGRNLSLLDDIAYPSAGFTQPHLRFANTAIGNDLTGFGSPPAADDPFKTWLQSFGLSDALGDADCDGIPNLIEYATGSSPVSAASKNPPSLETDQFSHRQLDAPGRLNYLIEISPDLNQWDPAALNHSGTDPNGDGTSTISYDVPTGDPRTFLRLRVTLE